MKKLISLVLILTIAAVIIVKYGKSASDSIQRWISFGFCDRPITYKINSIAPEFKISSEQLDKNISQAATIWQKVLNKPIFTKAEDGVLKINLVYDGRQTLVNAINQQSNSIESTKQIVSNNGDKFTQMQYELEQQIKKLNEQVDYWNKKGGAPKEIYDQLLATQIDLNQKISQLNSFADNINKNVSQLNQTIHLLNTNVTEFNSLINIKPEVGTYTSGLNTIDIYFYNSQQELVHVLAHEMGHALGLAHNAGTGAIMNPTASTSLAASKEDVNEITSFCANKNRFDLIKNDIQNAIYSVISKIGTKFN